MTKDSYFDINLINPKPADIGLPDNFKIKNIDLNEATSMEYWFEQIGAEAGTVEGDRYKMFIHVIYNDTDEYIFEITPSFSRLSGVFYPTPSGWENVWYMYNAHSDEPPFPLVITGGGHAQFDLTVFGSDPDYLLTIRSN